MVTGRVHVAQWGTYVAVSQTTGDFAMVRVRTRLANDGKTNSNCTLLTTLLDKDGKAIQTAEGKQDLATDWASSTRSGKPHHGVQFSLSQAHMDGGIRRCGAGVLQNTALAGDDGIPALQNPQRAERRELAR